MTTNYSNKAEWSEKETNRYDTYILVDKEYVKILFFLLHEFSPWWLKGERCDILRDPKNKPRTRKQKEMSVR